MKFFKTLFFAALLFFMLSANGQEIKLTDYGVKPWSFENATPAVVKALNEAKGKKGVIIKFPGGRIDLWPEGAVKQELYISNSTENDTLSKVKNLGICIDGLEDLVLAGNNTLIVLHGKMISFAILNSTNVTIKNIRFDYERPTMSELTVLAASDSVVKLRAHPDTRFTLKDGKIILFGEGWRSNHHHTILLKPDENIMRYSSWKPFDGSRAQMVGSDIIKCKGDFSGTKFEVGDVLTIRDPYRDNCGAFINRSKNISLENVKMHYMHGLGIVSQYSENILFKKVEVAPRKESGRAMAAFADCFHFSGCKGLVQLDSCRTSGSHDDPMNVHGTHLKITKIEKGNKLTVRFMHQQTYGFQAFFIGDSVAFVKPENVLVYDRGIIKKAQLISKREMVIELERNLPRGLKVGDCLENITWTPKVIVRNCHFERTNTRGMLVTTRRKVLIENNIFYRTGMHAILIANDCNYWYESGPVHDVTIRGNKFIQCGYNQGGSGAVIAIQPETHNFKKGKYIHSNIQIVGNEFQCVFNSLIFARAVENIKIMGNKISYSPLTKHEQKPVLNFKFEHCKGVVLKENLTEGFDHKVIHLYQMSNSELKVQSHQSGQYQIVK